MQDKMTQWITDSYERAEATAAALYGNGDAAALQINPYAIAPTDDSFQPGIPGNFSKGIAQVDVALDLERLHRESPLGMAFGKKINVKIKP